MPPTVQKLVEPFINLGIVIERGLSQVGPITSFQINGFVGFCVDDLDLWHAESKLQLGFSDFARRLLMPDIRANVN